MQKIMSYSKSSLITLTTFYAIVTFGSFAFIYENNFYLQQTLRSVLQATKCSNEMPAAGDDFDYYSSYAGFQDAMMIEGKRLLHM